ncbi:hypothetical protein ACS4JF_29380 [Bacillus thuringiensis]|uniref:hypothetical protein n=1 Tax=Bacillus thuringiensis TaxID=1428 RepID=UPI001FADF265
MYDLQKQTVHWEECDSYFEEKKTNHLSIEKKQDRLSIQTYGEAIQAYLQTLERMKL